uniref:G protein-coupled receptor 65 n=1 Tax=Latimeria chalumnae TaxID=7897 RepID=H2ZYS7_LATCH
MNAEVKPQSLPVKIMNNSNSCTVKHDFDMILFPIVYITVIVISIPANIVSLYVACLQVKKKNELGIYLFNLSLADLLYVTTLPLWIDFALKHDNWKHGKFLCHFSSFFMYTNFYASAAFMACISFDRYLAVVYPLRFHKLRTRKTAVAVTLGVWLLEIACSILISTHKELFAYMKTDYFCYDTFPLEAWKAKMNICRVFTSFLLPLFIMLFCYQGSYKAIKANKATMDVEKGKIKKLLLSILLTFILCFTPFHIMLLLRSIIEKGDEACEWAQVFFKPYKITLALSSFNCIADPILYCFISETGRKDIWHTITSISKRKDTIHSQKENSRHMDSQESTNMMVLPPDSLGN